MKLKLAERAKAIGKAAKNLGVKGMHIYQGLLPPGQSHANFNMIRGAKRAYRKATGALLTTEKAFEGSYNEVLLENLQMFTREIDKERHRLAARDAVRVFCESQNEARKAMKILDAVHKRGQQIAMHGRTTKVKRDEIGEQKAMEMTELLGNIRAKGLSELYLHKYYSLGKYFEPKNKQEKDGQKN